MGTYVILDYLSAYKPTASQMASAGFLAFSPSTSAMAALGYENQAVYSESGNYASQRNFFRVNLTEGASYHIYSSSFFDPFLLSLHDSQGSFIAIDSGSSYGNDTIRYVAPYTGTYYINASWDQGLASSHKFVYLSISEDIDTARPRDTNAPTITSFSPADEATRVAITENIVVKFSEAIQRGTGNIVLKSADGTTIAIYDAATSANLSISSSILTINPSADLAYSTGYKVELAFNTIKDLAGNSFAGTTSYNFTTAAAPDTIAPTIATFSPTDEAIGVAITENIVVKFSEAIQRGTGNIVLKSAAGTTIATYDAATSANLSISSSTLTINPSADLAYSTGYKVELASGTLKDLAGNSFAGTTSYNFTTAAPPSIIGTPDNDTITGGTGVAIDGLAGIDTVKYSSNYSPITYHANGTWTVQAQTLTNIERLKFLDQNLALDINGNAGMAAKILGAVFGRESVDNTEFVGVVLYLLDGGMSYLNVMQLALDARLGPSASHRAVVELLYTNVTGAVPSDQDTASLLSLLDSGDAWTLASFGIYAADHELNTTNIELAGLQTTGLAYIPYIG